MKKAAKKGVNVTAKPHPKPRRGDDLPEILPPRYDIVFKQVFAMRPDLLKSLLKSVIGLPVGEYGRVTVADPHIYPEREGEKSGVLDIKVVIRSKKTINVEMQQKKVAHLRERIVFYCSGMVKEQITSGDDYDKIKRVISIAITNHVAIPEDDAYHHRYTLYDPETRSEFTDLIEVHVIELPKLPKIDDGSELWRWSKFLTVKSKEELAMVAKKSPSLKKAADRLLSVSRDMRVRARLASQELFEMDRRIEMREAREKGLKNGLKSGLKKGMEKGLEKGTAAERARIVRLIERATSLDDLKRSLSAKKPSRKPRNRTPEKK